MKFFLIHPGTWNIFLEGFKVFCVVVMKDKSSQVIKIFSLSFTFQVLQMFLFFQYCTSYILINIIIPKQKKKKKYNPCQTWSDIIYIYKFYNAITFTLKSILLFWYLDNVLEKDKSGLLFQINMAWLVFTWMINWRGLHLSHIWTIHLYWV